MKTKKRQIASTFARMTGAALLLTITVPSAASGQGTLDVSPPSNAVANVGLEVQGHWSIEVYDPDGSLVRVHEFDNHLTPEGGAFLARLLAAQTGLAGCPWRVSLNSGLVDIAQPCAEGAGASDNLEIALVPIRRTGREFFPPGLNLIGTHTFQEEATIQQVATTVTTDESGTDVVNPFTAHTIPGLSVSAGQTVRATVNLEFPCCIRERFRFTDQGATFLTELLAGQRFLSHWTYRVLTVSPDVWTGPIAAATLVPGGLSVSWADAAPAADGLAEVDLWAVLSDGSELPFMFFYTGDPSDPPTVVAGQFIQIDTRITFN